MKIWPVIKALLFLAGFLLGSYGLSKVYTRIIMAHSICNRVDREFYRYDGRLEYLVMGDSHSQYGINPRVIGHAFNFSTAGENYVQTFFKLRFILDHTDKKIETILLPLDVHSFSSFRAGRLGLTYYYWVKYIDYIELGRRHGTLVSNLCDRIVWGVLV